MWPKFEGKARTREESAAYLATLKWDWQPEGITLHNTAAPTLAQWAESGPSHDARIRNLQNYYENELGWHAGPHFFVSRSFINWFSNPLVPGVHSRCWNMTRFGIEMVGDFNREAFNSGDGAMVRDNAVFLMALLNLRFGFKADDLTFHVECQRDNHDCPGKNVVKSDVIARVKAQMAALAQHLPTHPPAIVPPSAPAWASGKGSWYSQYRGKYVWRDSGDAPGSAALGVPDEQQGVSFYNHPTLGKWFEVQAPNGATSIEQQTDIGPAPWTHRSIDISSAAAERFGYSPQNFPTDSVFKWRPIDPPPAVVGLSPAQQARKYWELRNLKSPDKPSA